jgi:hypothetical protein
VRSLGRVGVRWRVVMVGVIASGVANCGDCRKQCTDGHRAT